MTKESISPEQKRQAIVNDLVNARAEYRRAVSRVMTMALSSEPLILSEAEKMGIGLVGSVKVAENLSTMAEKIKGHIYQPIINFNGEFARRKTTGILGIIADEPLMIKRFDDSGYFFSVPILSPIFWQGDEICKLGTEPVSINIAKLEVFASNDSNNSAEDPLFDYQLTDFTTTRPRLTVIGTDEVYRESREMPQGSLKVFRLLPNGLI